MRSAFPGHFTPTDDGFRELFNECIFAIDANVLLNLYRYSPDTRSALESALTMVKDRLFIPHQAAKEFLNNRLNVTAGQSEEYTSAIKEIQNLAARLANKKKHPFLPETRLPGFKEQVAELVQLLEDQKNRLLDKLIDDEILVFVENIFDGKVGEMTSEGELSIIIQCGEERYSKKIPPGYRDSPKGSLEDPSRKFGDLIVWKQIIMHASQIKKPVIFITDDKKDDWWLEQSGRTIGPRTELREEFIRDVGKNFWMYTVDKFIEIIAETSETIINKKVFEEIREVRHETKAAINEEKELPRFLLKAISREEMIERLASSQKWALENADGFLGLKSFVVNYLGNAGYDIAVSFDIISQLEEEGIVEIYDHHGEGHLRPAKALKLNVGYQQPFNPALSGIKELISRRTRNAGDEK
ncbi:MULTISPECIES: PIN-like domain-containing protein [Chromobacteriaceae]|uniref:PIN domain-containing protein n=1 Tax=Chromobacterium indicum TaxID=3110228 RepID=A0ABV0CI68_9NEIS|nr:PIN domain-containing protein [Pseudogulbenkiania ferrooxidans]